MSLSKDGRKRMRVCCYLLEPPAEEVVKKCLNDLDTKDEEIEYLTAQAMSCEALNEKQRMKIVELEAKQVNLELLAKSVSLCENGGDICEMADEIRGGAKRYLVGKQNNA